MRQTEKDFYTGYGGADLPFADRSSVHVCVVCALAEEARAFLRVVEKSCNISWTSGINRRYGYDYRLATLPNVKAEPLNIHVSWLPRKGPEGMLSHLSRVLEEYQPRLAVMPGICAGDKRYVHLGDLVVADRTFTYDPEKVVKSEQGQIQRQHDTITFQIPENTLGFVRFFDQWKQRVAALARPFSKLQQREWLLQRLLEEPTGSVLAIPRAEREKFAPAWRQIVAKLQQGPEPFLSSEWTLRDKAKVERLRFREIPFPFQDPLEARCYICPLASGSAVRSDEPFQEIQSLLRSTLALDMEASAFGRVMEMERFRGIEWLIVKGVSDYADQDKDDFYHTYAADVSATYILCFIEEYVIQERLSRSRYDQDMIQECVERADLAVNEAFPAVESVPWQQDERSLPHELACTELAGQGNPILLERASLQNRIGSRLYARGRYSEAESWYRQALAIYERQLGPEHPNTANSLNNLAVLYRAQGKYEQAERLYQRSLSIWEQQLEPEHPDMANNLNNLAVLYEAQGKYEQAERLYQQALLIREEQLGAEHLDTAISLNDLAVFYDSQGQYEQAEPLHVRARHIRERQLEPAHSSIAQSLNNLGLLYHHQGKYEQAGQLYRQALAISEEQLGRQHPHTAPSLNNLAALYYAQGKYSEAEPLYSRALSICEQKLEGSHPETALYLNNLAALYWIQGKYEQAESLYWRALSIYEQLGIQHPDAAQSLNNLAVLYNTQGKREQAESLYLQALEIWEHALGSQHPHTRAVRTNYALLLQAMR